MTTLKVPPALSQQIASHAERTYPEECCGVMLGTEVGGERVVQETLEIDNSQDANRRRRFLMTPEQYRNAEHTGGGTKPGFCSASTIRIRTILQRPRHSTRSMRCPGSAT